MVDGLDSKDYGGYMGDGQEDKDGLGWESASEWDGTMPLSLLNSGHRDRRHVVPGVSVVGTPGLWRAPTQPVEPDQRIFTRPIGVYHRSVLGVQGVV